MQNTPYTTFYYIAKRFILFYFVGLVFFSSIILLFDSIELFRRAGTASNNIHPTLVFKMAVLHLPNTLQEIIPFIFLFATMFFFWRFQQTSQLIILRNMGLSVWRLLLPIISIALVYSIFEFVVFNPVGAVFMEKFERINATIFKKRSDTYTVSSRGIWVRDTHKTGYALVHAKRVDLIAQNILDITIYTFSDDNIFLQRIDAASGKMGRNQWMLQKVLVSDAYKITEALDEFQYETDIDMDAIRDRFLSPDTLSIWALPKFIQNVENAGLSSINYKFYLYKTILRPLLFLAMIFFAALVSYPPSNRRRNPYPIFFAILIAFFIYLFTNMMRAFATSFTLPVFLAAAGPALISLFSSLALLIYLEEK